MTSRDSIRAAIPLSLPLSLYLSLPPPLPLPPSLHLSLSLSQQRCSLHSFSNCRLSLSTFTHHPSIPKCHVCTECLTPRSLHRANHGCTQRRSTRPRRDVAPRPKPAGRHGKRTRVQPPPTLGSQTCSSGPIGTHDLERAERQNRTNGTCPGTGVRTFWLHSYNRMDGRD